MISRHLSTLTLLASFSLLTACQTTDPALYECQQLLEEINAVVIDAKTLIQGEQESDNSSPNLDIWLQAADILKNGSEAIAGLDISDSELQIHQTEISTLYSEQAQATYAMVEAWQKKDLQTALNAQKRSAAAGELEATAGEALNTYCQNKKIEFNQ